MNKPLTLGLLTLSLAGAIGIGYLWGSQPPRTAPLRAQTPDERPVLYWYDPMVPDKRFDKPGKSPFMDMQLIPRYADDAPEDGGVTISVRQQQNLGVRTTQAKMRTTAAQISGYGRVTLNERALRTIVAPSGGIIEQLNVNAVQQQVRQGDTLATLWNPAWSAAQREYLAVRQLNDSALTQAARQRLALLFMPESVIHRVERSGKPQPRMTITAPEAGYVNKLEVRAGMQLTPAQPLFELASLDPVWIEIDYPQAQAARLNVGDQVAAGNNAWPGKTFHGVISELLPALDDATQTLKARVILDNPQQQLKPGMYLSVRIDDAKPQPRLMIPQQALLISGSQNRVLLSDGDGHFVPRKVTVGIVHNDWAEITDGLSEGDTVVTSGQFLIDSEANLRSSLSQFGDEKQESPPRTSDEYPAGYQTIGVIKAINGDHITIEHDAVPALNWAPMTMDFRLSHDGPPQGIGIGSRVRFRFHMDDRGVYIQDIAPLNAGHGGHQ
ncbi:efflux RND transporter periplasmic adaptor subunit [Brenneria sp. 4F2]|nr:efflux RND transporter periplasmic adaptor subunit [Brenneria bubanii]